MKTGIEHLNRAGIPSVDFMEFTKQGGDLISLGLDFNNREDFLPVPFRGPCDTTSAFGNNKTFTIARGCGCGIVVLMNGNFIRKSRCWKI
jgi:hypothetical protein